MIKVLPFSALKRHLQGEIFTPVDMGAHYELQSATRVMCGSNGNTYRFKTAENAALWLDTNTIKAVKNQITKQSAIDSLIIKNMAAPSDWLAEEIATLQARANGDWAAFHTGEDLLDEWGIIAKGDKGDPGAPGAPGVNGVIILKSELFSFNINPRATARQQIYEHGLGGLPTFLNKYYECVTAGYGWVVGDKLEILSGMMNTNIELTDSQIVVKFGAISSFGVVGKSDLVAQAVNAANNFKLVVQAFRIV